MSEQLQEIIPTKTVAEFFFSLNICVCVCGWMASQFPLILQAEMLALMLALVFYIVVSSNFFLDMYD